MNPNPWGAFAEGIASGISGGMNNYATLKMKALENKREELLKKLDRDRKDAEVQIKTGIKLLDYVKDDPEAFGRAIGQLGTGLSHFSSSKEGEPNYLNQDYLSKIGEFVTQKEEGKKWLYNEKRNIESLVDKEVITEEQGLYRLYEAINKKGNELKVEQKVIDEVIKPFREGAKEEKEKQSLIQAGTKAGLTEEQAQIYAESEQGRAALQALMKETVSPTITDYDRWEKDPEAFEKYKEAGRDKEKTGQNWLLPNKQTVISYDGGRTYAGAGGQAVAMPYNAMKVPGGATLGEFGAIEAKKQAEAELREAAQKPPGGVSPTEVAKEGTGPYKRIASAFEAVAGGLGVDTLIGKEGFFPEIADAKQYLRTVKQIGKAALMNSSRGAVWEQERIDQLFPDPDATFVNPAIEARKFKSLEQVLTTEKLYNNQAILTATDPKEISKYRASNNEIDRLLAMTKDPTIANPLGLSEADKALIDKWRKK